MDAFSRVFNSSPSFIYAIYQKLMDFLLLFHWLSDISFDFFAIYLKSFPVYSCGTIVTSTSAQEKKFLLVLTD